MKCKRFERLIQKKLDGEIADGGRGLLDKHLAVCAACREALADYEWIAQGLAAERPVGEGSIRQAVMDRIRTPRRRFRFAPAIAAVAAAVAAIVMLIVMARAARRAGDVRPEIVVTPPVREEPAQFDLEHIETPDVLGDSQRMLADNVETLRADAQTAREALAETFEDFTRDLPLL